MIKSVLKWIDCPSFTAPKPQGEMLRPPRKICSAQVGLINLEISLQNGAYVLEYNSEFLGAAVLLDDIKDEAERWVHNLRVSLNTQPATKATIEYRSRAVKLAELIGECSCVLQPEKLKVLQGVLEDFNILIANSNNNPLDGSYRPT